MATKASKHVWRTLLIGLAIITAAIFVDLRYPATLDQFELKVFDLRMYASGGRKPLGKVAIAAIDDKSVSELGRWPWSRSVMARLVSALGDYKVATIGFDIDFSEPDNNDVQREAIAARMMQAGLDDRQIASILGAVSNDEKLAQALREQGNAWLGFPFQSHGRNSQGIPTAAQGYVTTVVPPGPLAYGIVLTGTGAPPNVPTSPAYLPNIPVIGRAARGSAFFDIDIDPDAIIRREMMVIRFNGKYYAPLCLAMVAAYRGNAQLAVRLDASGVQRVAVGDEEIPVDNIGRMLMRFRGRAQTFPHLSTTDIIKHRIPASDLAGKIVLVGVTGRGLGDKLAVPFGADYPGVEVHANATDNILAGDFVHQSRLDAGIQKGAAVLVGVAVSLAVAYLSAAWSAATTLALAAGYFAVAQFLLMDGTLIGVMLPLVTLVATYTGLASYRYVTEGIEKRHLRHAFEHYLHPDIIASVVDQPDALKLGGERRHLSILFSDIVDFTQRAEQAKPEELVGLLNIYMTVMTDLILASGGVVDKLMGDGIMAFWGAPATVANPARSAIDCAIAMRKELQLLRERDPRFGDFRVGIGIATGDPIVGNVGGERRFDYSVIGDAANLASRVEGLTRQFKIDILVTLQTFVEAAGSYVAREIGLVKVKGRREVVPMVEIAAHANDGLDPTYFERFSKAVASLRQGAQKQAYDEFAKLAAENPKDRAVQMYLDRMKSHGDEPPAEIVFEFDTK